MEYPDFFPTCNYYVMSIYTHWNSFILLEDWLRSCKSCAVAKLCRFKVWAVDRIFSRDVYRIESIVSYWYHKTDTSIVSK